MAHGILTHETPDDVGVAVRDLQAGEEVGVVTLEGQEVGLVKVIATCPWATRWRCATWRPATS